MSTTTSRAARSLVAVGVAGTASVLGVGAASAAPSTSVDHLATATSVRPVGASTSVAAAVASPLTFDIGDWLGRPPWGCFVCGLGGFPPIDDLVMPTRGL